METKKRTGIYYGGAFDPIRQDHAKIMEHIAQIITESTTSEISFIVGVTNNDEKKYGASFHDRYTMVCNTIDELHKDPKYYMSKLTVNDNLVKCPDRSVTVISQNQRIFSFLTVGPDCMNHKFDHIILVVGSDEFEQIMQGKWENADLLRTLPRLDFWVIDRDGKYASTDMIADQNTLQTASVIHLDNLGKDESSTGVRTILKHNLSMPSGMLPPSVEKYISANHLYTRTDEDLNAECEFIKQYDITKFPRPSVTSTVVPVYTDKDTGKQYFLLIKRKDHPYKGMWAFPGGFLELHRQENIYEAAVRELKEETALVADVEDLKLLDVYSDVDLDPRGRIIDNGFVAYITDTMSALNASAQDDAAELRWFSADTIPLVLAFHHRKMLEKVLNNG